MALADDFYLEQRRSNRRIAEALLGEGTKGEPIAAHSQGLNRVAQGLLGGLMLGQEDRENKAREERISKLLAGIPGGGEPEGIPASAAGPIYGSDFSTRAPDGMDRSISSGPRSPTMAPITTAPPVPAEPGPWRVAGMPPPTNSQDTFRTPLDAMAPREQGLAALRTAMGGQPPMTGMTPAGATPVQTQAIQPPAPAPAAPAAAPPVPLTPPAAAAAPGGDQAMAKYVRALLAEPATRQYGMQLQQMLMTKAASEKPTFGKIGTDSSGQDVMGWIDPRRQTTTPAPLPGGGTKPSGEIQAEMDRIIAAGGDPKTARIEATKRAMGETIPVEAAGRLAMMDTAKKGMAETRKTLEGDWDAKKIAQYYAAKSGVGAAAGEVGIAMRDVRLGVEAALRTMTGAAAPESEVKRYVDLFAPTPFDDANSRKQKMDALNDFMETARRNIQQGRTLPGAAASPVAAPTPTAAPPIAAPDKSALKKKYGLE